MPSALTGRARALPPHCDVAVIGSGLVGLATARELALKGAEVVVVERGRIGTGASFANGGLIAPSHSVPLAAPGVMRKVLRWMPDPASPFYARPRLDPEFARFLLRFALACRPSRLARGVRAMRDLNLLSIGCMDEIVRDLSGFEFVRSGLLNVYKSADAWEHGRREAQMLAEFGLDSTLLQAEALWDEEPCLAQRPAGGVLWPKDGYVDPELFSGALAADLRERGVLIEEGLEVIDLGVVPNGVVVRTVIGNLLADKVVIAAGSWTAKLAKRVSRPFPLQPAKGYSMTVFEPHETLRRPVLLTDAKIAATPLPGRMRLAGTLELGGYDLSIAEARARAVLRSGKAALGQAAEGGEVRLWAGLRALSSDGLPIIGPLTGAGSVLVATGHGHAGVGMAAGTGKLVAALASKDAPPIDPRPYSPARFRR